MMSLLSEIDFILFYNILGILIFQAALFNMTIDAINYFHNKNNTVLNYDKRRYITGIVITAILLLIAGYGAVISEDNLWILVIPDLIILSIYVIVTGRIKLTQSALLIIILCFVSVSSIYCSMLIADYRKIINSGIICLVECIVINIFMKLDVHRFTGYETFVLLLNAAISVVIIHFLMDVDKELYQYCGMVCVAVNCFMVFRMVYRIKDSQQKEREQIKTISDLQLQNQYLNSVYIMDEHTRKVRHDLKNHMNTMRTLLEDEHEGRVKTIEYINQYVKQTSLMYETVKTDNKVVNAVINSKLLYCAENGINTSVSVCKDVSNLSDVEICTVLGNLLDNAIEAELKNDEHEREIQLNINMEEDMLNIFVKNKIKESVLATNHELKTTKKDAKNHGIGMKNIYDIVTRHNGYIDVYEEADYICFNLQI